MKSIFVDTGAWIGLAVARDHTHPSAVTFAKEIADRGRQMLTTNYVLLESHTRIRYDDGHSKAMMFEALIQEMVRRRKLTVLWINPEIHELALQVFRKYSDQELSIVDCSSIVVARARKIRDIFGFDSDFAKLGFTLRP